MRRREHFEKLTKEQQELVIAWIPMARKMARAFAGRVVSGNNQSAKRAELAEELEAEAVLGLCRAASRFEPERKLSFSTYAVYHVRDRFYKALPMLLPTTLDNEKSALLDEESCRRAARCRPVGTGVRHARLDRIPDADSEDVQRALALICSSRNRELFKRRIFGNQTLAQIGKEHGIARERVRQVIEDCKKILRRNPRFREILEG